MADKIFERDIINSIYATSQDNELYLSPIALRRAIFAQSGSVANLTGTFSVSGSNSVILNFLDRIGFKETYMTNEDLRHAIESRTTEFNIEVISSLLSLEKNHYLIIVYLFNKGLISEADIQELVKMSFNTRHESIIRYLSRETFNVDIFKNLTGRLTSLVTKSSPRRFVNSVREYYDMSGPFSYYLYWIKRPLFTINDRAHLPPATSVYNSLTEGDGSWWLNIVISAVLTAVKAIVETFSVISTSIYAAVRGIIEGKWPTFDYDTKRYYSVLINKVFPELVKKSILNKDMLHINNTFYENHVIEGLENSLNDLYVSFNTKGTENTKSLTKYIEAYATNTTVRNTTLDLRADEYISNSLNNSHLFNFIQSGTGSGIVGMRANIRDFLRTLFNNANKLSPNTNDYAVHYFLNRKDAIRDNANRTLLDKSNFINDEVLKKINQVTEFTMNVSSENGKLTVTRIDEGAMVEFMSKLSEVIQTNDNLKDMDIDEFLTLNNTALNAKLVSIESDVMPAVEKMSDKYLLYKPFFYKFLENYFKYIRGDNSITLDTLFAFADDNDTDLNAITYRTIIFLKEIYSQFEMFYRKYLTVTNRVENPHLPVLIELAYTGALDESIKFFRSTDILGFLRNALIDRAYI